MIAKPYQETLWKKYLVNDYVVRGANINGDLQDQSFARRKKSKGADSSGHLSYFKASVPKVKTTRDLQQDYLE